MNVQEKIDHDYVVGVIRFNDVFRYHFMSPIYWVTDSDQYDPDYIEGRLSDPAFRSGVGKINQGNADLYLSSIEEDRIEPSWIKENLSVYGDSLLPIFYVDIDNYMFISNFFDLDYEDHVGPGWQGVFDDPLKHLPDNVNEVWV